MGMCPFCGSNSVDCSRDDDLEMCVYTCEECGCEWTVESTISILKHGEVEESE